MRVSSSQRVLSFTLSNSEFHFDASSEFPFDTNSEFRFPCTSSNIHYTFLMCTILRRHGAEEEWEEGHLSVMGLRGRRHMGRGSFKCNGCERKEAQTCKQLGQA